MSDGGRADGRTTGAAADGATGAGSRGTIRDSTGSTTGSGPAPRAAEEHRATVKDVAEAAGVSRSTASRALTGSGYVGQGVHERVQRAADRLGYVPDAMARNLKQRVSRTIGLLVPDVSSAVAAGLVAGVTREASRRGYATVLVGDAVGDLDAAEAAERFVALRVAGVVAHDSGDVVAHLVRLRTPVVEVGSPSAGGLAPAPVADESRPTLEVTGRLLAVGRTAVSRLLDGGTAADDDVRTDGWEATVVHRGSSAGPASSTSEGGWAAARPAVSHTGVGDSQGSL